MFDRVGDCRAKVPSAFNADGSFKNNQIPAACIDPLAAKIIGLLPGPNVFPGSGALNQLNFVRAPGIIDDTDSHTTRVDWQANSSNTLFVRYTNLDPFRYLPPLLRREIRRNSRWKRVVSQRAAVHEGTRSGYWLEPSDRRKGCERVSTGLGTQ